MYTLFLSNVFKFINMFVCFLFQKLQFNHFVKNTWNIHIITFSIKVFKNISWYIEN